MPNIDLLMVLTLTTDDKEQTLKKVQIDLREIKKKTLGKK